MENAENYSIVSFIKQFVLFGHFLATYTKFILRPVV